jgi:hypothetical protein
MFEYANMAAPPISTVHGFQGAGSIRTGHSKEVGMTDRGLDEPVPDVVEQSQEVVPAADDADEADEAELLQVIPLEADPADAAEQAREVELGEDDYR